MKLSRGTFILAVVGLAPLSLQAGSDANLPWEEYDKLINARTTIEPLGTDLFGDQVNLYNTGLSFSVTDISLPGNHDLPVALTRMFSVKSRKSNVQNLPMATWDLDLPRIEGMFTTTWHDDRCDTLRPDAAWATGSEIIFVDDNDDYSARPPPRDETLSIDAISLNWPWHACSLRCFQRVGFSVSRSRPQAAT